MNSLLRTDNSIAAYCRGVRCFAEFEYREDAGRTSCGATPDTGRFLRRMENQSDESDEIAPAQSLSAVNQGDLGILHPEKESFSLQEMSTKNVRRSGRQAAGGRLDVA
jgi:hypothetical protein